MISSARRIDMSQLPGVLISLKLSLKGKGTSTVANCLVAYPTYYERDGDIRYYQLRSPVHYLRDLPKNQYPVAVPQLGAIYEQRLIPRGHKEPVFEEGVIGELCARVSLISRSTLMSRGQRKKSKKKKKKQEEEEEEEEGGDDVDEDGSPKQRKGKNMLFSGFAEKVSEQAKSLIESAMVNSSAMIAKVADEVVEKLMNKLLDDIFSYKINMHESTQKGLGQSLDFFVVERRLQCIELDRLQVQSCVLQGLCVCFYGNLQRISLNSCSGVTDNLLRSLADAHGNVLEELEVERCRAVTDYSLFYVTRKCLRLKVLNISDTSDRVSDATVLSAAELSCLESFSAAYLSTISNMSLVLILNSPQLKHLDISGCERIDDAVFLSSNLLSSDSSLPSNLRLDRFQNLTSLSMDFCNVGSEALSSLAAASCPLKIVSFAHCTRIDDEAIFLLASRTPTLELVNLSSTPLGDEGVYHLLDYCRLLARLNVSLCPNISPDSLTFILALGLRLREVEMIGAGGGAQAADGSLLDVESLEEFGEAFRAQGGNLIADLRLPVQRPPRKPRRMKLDV
eukprot:755017-Hanusia_phi.AAC.2